jgi:hypothetical protein
MLHAVRYRNFRADKRFSTLGLSKIKYVNIFNQVKSLSSLYITIIIVSPSCITSIADLLAFVYMSISVVYVFLFRLLSVRLSISASVMNR